MRANITAYYNVFEYSCRESTPRKVSIYFYLFLSLTEQKFTFLVYYSSIDFWAGPEENFPPPPRNLGPHALDNLSARFDRLSL